MSVLNPINKSFCLEQLCEANYLKLLKLIPDLLSIEDSALGTAKLKTAILIHILERSPYTLTIELNHTFDQQHLANAAPALQVRIYLDVKSAEVLRDYMRSDVQSVFKHELPGKAVMDYKWRLNYFLSKWLDHCLQAQYQF